MVVSRMRGQRTKSLAASVLVLVFLILQATVVLAAPSSVGAANYYEMKPNPFYLSLGVKGYQQTTDYTCGPAAVMSLMRWHDLLKDADMNAATEMRIAAEMGTGDMNAAHPGTSPEQMATWLREHGYTVITGENGTLEMLRSYMGKGMPVLVEWIDWGGHWVVATGYYAGSESPSKGSDTIFFADPAVHWTTANNPDGILSFNAWRFRDMWFDAQYFKPGQLVRNIYISLFRTNPSISDRQQGRRQRE